MAIVILILFGIGLVAWVTWWMCQDEDEEDCNCKNEWQKGGLMYHNILEGIGWTVGMLCALSIACICIYIVVYFLTRSK